MFKNLSVRLKIGLGYGVALAFLVVITVIAALSINTISNSFVAFDEGVLRADNAIAEAQLQTNYGARTLREMFINTDSSTYPAYVESIENSVAIINENVDILNETYSENDGLIDEYKSKLADWIEIKDRAISAIQQGDMETAQSIVINECAPALESLDQTAAAFNEKTSAMEDSAIADTVQMSKESIRFLLVMLVIIFAIGLLLARVISAGITKPLKVISNTANEMSRGNLKAPLDYESKNELGALATDVRQSMDTLSVYVSEIDRIMEQMAAGDFNIAFQQNFIGDFENIERSIRKYSDNMSTTLEQIDRASSQVTTGSDQVSSGAQELAQGATEQAATVQELADTLNEASIGIKQNADSAKNVNEQMKIAGGEMSASNEKMASMIDAMAQIKNSSNEIGKIIKTIEDIAFQTNILALNAAVEAARAGEAGKGFAVVADEVRNLASKSAEASGNTARLIETSLQAVDNGSRIVDETASSLSSAAEGISQIVDEVDAISQGTGAQAAAVSQITQGIDQISSVVQNNSATAEQSAAASEELSGQAQVMQELISQFKLKNAAGASCPEYQDARETEDADYFDSDEKY